MKGLVKPSTVSNSRIIFFIELSKSVLAHFFFSILILQQVEESQKFQSDVVSMILNIYII